MHVNNDPVAERIREIYPYRVNLQNCDEEPLRHIQVVQAHACLLAVDVQDMTIRYVSENTESVIGTPWEQLMDQSLRAVLPIEVTAQIAVGMNREDGFDTLNPIQAFFSIDAERILKNVIVHRTPGYLLVEVEAASEYLQASRYQQLLSRAIGKIQHIQDYSKLFSETASVIRQVTSYDRVMVYKFDREFNGEVIAESSAEHLDSWLGLRYPHTDIPKQARDLYLKNRIRFISNGTVPPARLRMSEATGGQPLDLTQATSRGVSPVHLEYLDYMGVNNSLSLAIILEGKLWGLFALHHYSPRFVDYSIRNMLSFVGQIFSGHLSLQAANQSRQSHLSRNLARLAIGEMITKTRDLFDGLTQGTHNIMNMFPGVSGAAIHFEDRFESFRKTPPEEDIKALIEHVQSLGDPENHLIYATDNLQEEFPPFEAHCEDAAGAMIIFINQEYTNWVCWFRPTVTQTIAWGGKPAKEVVTAADGSTRLGPRRSFARYIEKVEGCSAPWLKEEVDVAISLRITIVNSLMQRYAEVKQVNEQLKKALQDLETFSYTVSHDLRAPLRAINGFAEILTEDYGAQLEPEAHQLITKIHAGVEQMNSFITDILELSRVGNGGLSLEYQDVGSLSGEVISEVQAVYAAGVNVDINVADDMPEVVADKRMLRQLLQNLISNAFKYMSPTAAGRLGLEIGCRQRQQMGENVYYVSNTGPPIPEEFTRTIFEMFSRLNNQSETEGTGVGLAIVDRIVNRHDGQVWVTDDVLGVTFNFYLKAEKS